MSIISSELVWRKPAEASEAGTNGGRMTAVSISSGVKNNLFPDVPQSERVAGSTKYRKAFIHNVNDSHLALISPKVFALFPTPGDDFVVIFPGTQSDTQSGIGTPAQLYGAGKLTVDAAANATTIQVTVENWALAPIFAAGMVIRLSSKTSVDDATGNEEYRTIAPAGVSANANNITLTLTAGLTYSYSASSPTNPGYVSSVITPADMVAAITAPQVSVAGSYNNGSYPAIADNTGSIEQNWTLNFSSASNFTVTGDTVGLVGAFSTGNDCAPTNPNFTSPAKPYFTLSRFGWAGTANNTVVTFTTHPASIPIWYKRVVPAGAASFSGDKCIIGIDGESA